MNQRGFHRLLLSALLLLLIVAPAARAAELNHQQEGQVQQIEGLLGELLGSYDVKPVYHNLGGGFHGMSIALSAEARERLAAARSEEDAAKAANFFVLAAGQQLTEPSSSSVLIHAALSNMSLSYNYWVATVNLGAGTRRATNLKLTGPGRKFNRTFQHNYTANSIWVVWYTAPSVNRAGAYTLVGTVTGAGADTVKSYAVRP